MPETLTINPEEESRHSFFTPEQEIDLGPIDPVRAEYAQEILELESQDLAQAGLESFQTAAKDRYKKQLEDFGPGTLEQKMLGVFWNIGNMVQSRKRNAELVRELGFVGNAEPNPKRRQKIINELRELSQEMAGWQNELARVCYNLAGNVDGKAYLENVWQMIGQIGGEDMVKVIKSNVFGTVTTINLLQSLDFKVYMPTNEQDALKKMDALGEKDGRLVILQIKSHADPIFDVDCTRLDRLTPGEHAPYSSAKDKKDQDNLQAGAREIKQKTGTTFREVVPAWIDLHSRGLHSFNRNPSTGMPEPPMDRTIKAMEKLRQALEE